MAAIGNRRYRFEIRNSAENIRGRYAAMFGFDVLVTDDEATDAIHEQAVSAAKRLRAIRPGAVLRVIDHRGNLVWRSGQ